MNSTVSPQNVHSPLKSTQPSEDEDEEEDEEEDDSALWEELDDELSSTNT